MSYELLVMGVGMMGFVIRGIFLFLRGIKYLKDMKTRILVIGLILLSGLSGNATNVSGFISANTTWSTGGNPYHVIGNTLVVNGVTLTIEPGVVVKFDTGKVLQIDGELIAIGTVVNRITFTSNESIPHAGDWGKIHFSDTCVDAVFDALGHYVSGSIMKYCDVLYGGGIGFGAIHIINSSPYFSQCNIMNSSTAGIYSTESSYIIDSSLISYCADYGLSYNGYSILQNIRILSDTISYNSNGGVGLPGIHNAIIKNNFFIGNNNRSAFIIGGGVDSLLFSENYFEGNTCAQSVVYLCSPSYNYIIECNKFYNNHGINGNGPFVLYINDLSTASGNFIRNNIFEGNVSQNSSILFLYTNPNLYYSADTIHNLYLTNNYFHNNTFPVGSCIEFLFFNIGTILHVHNNSFMANTGVSVLDFEENAFNVSGFDLTDIKNNNLINPNSQFELYNGIPYGSPNIYADSNYWGSLNTQHIDSVIHDFFDDGNLFVVYYLPILTSLVSIDTSCSPNLETGILAIKPPTLIKVYPNPFSNEATLTIEGSYRNTTLTIYNLMGEEVQRKAVGSNKQIAIERNHLPAGMYFYKVVEENGDVLGMGKLIVE